MTRKPRKKIVARSPEALIGMDRWVAETAATFARGMLSKINDQEKLIGPEYRKALTAQFLSAYIAGTVSEALYEAGKNEERVMREFSEAKQLTQLAVAGGFEAALGEYSGEFVEYYCTIKVVPEPLTETVN